MKVLEDFFGEKTSAKNIFILLVNLFLVTLVFWYGTTAWKEIRSVVAPPLQLSIDGQGKISANPDVAEFTATVTSSGAELRDTQSDNITRSNDVMNYLKNQGVQEKDIKTVDYNIYPQYSYPQPCSNIYPCPLNQQTQKIIGYQIRTSVQI